jgi:N6-adenosine-specific RNA methylase IME4
MSSHAYRTIVADPPWRYAAAATKADASKHYSTMPLDDICNLGSEVGRLVEDDAHLWLWTTNAFMEEGHQVVRAWGFRPLTILTWCKKQPGVGYYLRNTTEHAILASRGNPIVPDEKAMSSWYVWPRGVHSAKPEAFLDLVEQVSPGPYLEMFSRRNRLGWDTWGNEALEHVSLAAVVEE